jgi:multidrug resistance efflux pump
MASIFLNTLPDGYRIDAKLGAIYDTSPHSVDDLTQIHGIETREAVGLYSLGIYFYAQLASWTDSQTTAVADALGMSASLIFHDRWTAQARKLSPTKRFSPPLPAAPDGPPQADTSAHPFPASRSRTITILTCALLIGCLFVSWVNRSTHRPLTGILTAEITSLRVPADSRLLSLHVSAGDEVFTGNTLLTLEKSEHVQLISQQTGHVHRLAKALQQAQTQAAIERQWRSQQLEYKLGKRKIRTQFFQRNYREHNDNAETTELQAVNASLSTEQLQTVSHSRDMTHSRTDHGNALLFISGASRMTTLDSPTSTPTAPLVTAIAPTITTLDSHNSLLLLETQSIESRLQNLEELVSRLPPQVIRAARVEHLRTEHQKAQERLAKMKSLSRETAVVCPAYGTIGQVHYNEGDRMVRDEIMIKILHTDRKYVVAYVPTSQIKELQPGTQVDVIFHGHDACLGTITNLPMITNSNPINGRSMASVRVESTGRSWPEIPIGSQIEVVIR